MKTYRSILAFLSLIALTAVLWALATPARADPTSSSAQAAVSGQVGGPGGGGAVAAPSSADAGGSALTGATTERVTFSGNAVVRARVMPDPDFRTPDIVVLFIDMSGVTGVGATTRKKYVTTNKTIVQRRLRPTDTVDVNFPFWVSGTSATGSGPVGKMSIALTYDMNAKVLASAAGSVTGQ